jgi:YegS/Rv2252/BmrU family lipid kinase
MSNKAGKRPAPLLIFNPHAGGGRDPRGRLDEAVSGLREHGLRVDVATVKSAVHGTEIAARAVRAGCRLVIAMGGDGTIEAVGRGLIGTKARLGIIPAGTMNNVARSLGIPEDIPEACRILGEGHKRRIDLGQVKTAKHGTHYFFEAAVVGLETALYPIGDAVPKRDWRRVARVITTLIRYRLPTMTVRLDDEAPRKVDSLLAVIANTPNFGSVYLVAPQARLDDGQLDVALYEGFTKAEILAYLAEVTNERSAGSGRVQRYQARKIRIKAKPKQLVMVDDVRVGKGPVTIRIKRRALRVVAPEVQG